MKPEEKEREIKRQGQKMEKEFNLYRSYGNQQSTGLPSVVVSSCGVCAVLVRRKPYISINFTLHVFTSDVID